MQIFEKLPPHLESLLMIMKKNLPETYLTGLQNKFVIEIKEQLSEYAEIEEIVKLRKNINELQQFVKGLSILKKCEFIDFEKEVCTIYYFLERFLFNRIFIIFSLILQRVL